MGVAAVEEEVTEEKKEMDLVSDTKESIWSLSDARAGGKLLAQYKKQKGMNVVTRALEIDKSRSDDAQLFMAIFSATLTWSTFHKLDELVIHWRPPRALRRYHRRRRHHRHSPRSIMHHSA